MPPRQRPAAPAIVSIGFLRGALQHADVLTFQRLQRRLDRRAFGRDQPGVGGIELVREGDLLLALLGDGERGDDGVNFLRLEGGIRESKSLPTGTFHLNTGAQFIA